MQTRRSIYELSLIAGVLLVAVCVMPSRADACSTTPPDPDFGWGEPSDDSTDVPTDVILYYPIPIAALSAEGVPGTFRLTTMDSIEVAITPRRVHYWNYELVPAEALAPNTTYELTGTWTVGTEEVAKTIRFTTGAGPLEDAPAKPDVMVEHYQLMTDVQSSCDPSPSGTCLSYGDADLFVEYAYVDGFDQVHEPYLTRGAAMIDISGIDQGTPFECVQLRTRAMNGTYSEPARLCRGAGALAQLTSPDLGCTPEGLTSATTPMDIDPYDAGEETEEPMVDADVIGTPRTDAAAVSDESEMAEQAPTLGTGGCSCSAVGHATGAGHARAGWALCIALMAATRRRCTYRSRPSRPAARSSSSP